MGTVSVCADGTSPAGSRNYCDDCILWELRLQVAVRATYYLALHIREVDLRIAVLEDLTAAWAVDVFDGAGPEGFQRFFAGYCADVERDVDPSKRNTPEHPAEY